MSGLTAQRWQAGESCDVPERGRLVVDAGEISIGIFRLNGELHAYENRCTHAGGPICQGLMIPRIVELLDDRQAIVGSAFDESELHIACPWHGAEYSIRTGRHAGGGAMALKRFPVEETGGQIYVTV